MMTQINGLLASKGIYFLTLLLLLLGVYGMVSCKNYMKKLICMNIMQVAVIFFYLCFAQKKGGTIPVALDTIVNADKYVNPIPHGLIVVSLGTTGVGLALLTRIKEKYGSIEEDDIIRRENRFK